MINKKIFAFLVCAFFLAGAVIVNALALKDSEPVSVGELQVWPILDANVTMESSLLPGLKDFPQYEGVFANGPAPAVDQTFLVPINDRLVLIDTGWGKGGPKDGRTLDILSENNIKPENIGDILLTHMDIDHIGGLLDGDKATFPNATLWISKPEYEAWINGNLDKRPEVAKAKAKKVAELYKDRIKLFEYGDEIMPGITAIEASGHTPGHTAFDITNGGQKLTVAGDIIHIWPVQLPLPQLSTTYDIDMEKAAKTRERLLDRAAAERSLFAGMHFPMISPVIKRADGGFNMREPR
ncbi:MAG: MBL fold metallo-hydrolase [Desulfovibrio sp.]|nr:MBL fold metallo-hydrolase [Desulfovibrio sp.]